MRVRNYHLNSLVVIEEKIKANNIIFRYVVTVTENGKLAYDELRDENKDFDLVLLDLYMPEMDGLQLLSLMQEDDRFKQIPVVVMSANDTNEIIANCLSKRYLF